MRVRIIRWTDPTSSSVSLRVQRWASGQWDPVQDFPLNESEQANEFAMKLSMTKRDPVELAGFEDGQKLERLPLAPLTMPVISGCSPSDADHSYNSIRNGDQKLESQS